MDKKSKTSVIVVTNNSELYIDKNMEALFGQTLKPDQILLVDSGSKHLAYLEKFKEKDNVSVLFAPKGCGFCKANNVGWDHVRKDNEFVFFLNPDAFLTPQYIEKAQTFLQNPKMSHVGAVTGVTVGYDIQKGEPTFRFDTTGISSTWYGKWYDRSQGVSVDQISYETIEPLEAICGAVFFCRKTALQSIAICGREIFDETFFMYKEDIDLSLRLREKGWDLIFNPTLSAYHCRGWAENKKRKDICRTYRLSSAKNEWTINRRYHKMGSFYSLLKYLAVKVFNF